MRVDRQTDTDTLIARPRTSTGGEVVRLFSTIIIRCTCLAFCLRLRPVRLVAAIFWYERANCTAVFTNSVMAKAFCIRAPDKLLSDICKQAELVRTCKLVTRYSRVHSHVLQVHRSMHGEDPLILLYSLWTNRQKLVIFSRLSDRLYAVISNNNISNYWLGLCSKCPPFASFAVTHSRRRVHHCLTAVSITRWSSLSRAAIGYANAVSYAVKFSNTARRINLHYLVPSHGNLLCRKAAL